MPALLGPNACVREVRAIGGYPDKNRTLSVRPENPYFVGGIFPDNVQAGRTDFSGHFPDSFPDISE
jgi:hypothetical protein